MKNTRLGVDPNLSPSLDPALSFRLKISTPYRNVRRYLFCKLLRFSLTLKSLTQFFGFRVYWQGLLFSRTHRPIIIIIITSVNHIEDMRSYFILFKSPSKHERIDFTILTVTPFYRIDFAINICMALDYLSV